MCVKVRKSAPRGMAAEKLVGGRTSGFSAPARDRPGSGRECVESWPPDPEGPVARDEALEARL